MSSFLYPASPLAVPEDKLAPSTAFKKQVGKVIFSILLFFAVYILLVIASVALATACAYGGLAIIMAIPRLITILIGLGLVALGISVIFFLIKFIFAVSKNENPSRIEITEEEQPRLFAFIRKLTEETKTPFPKRIFVSPDVNACVFFNSSFWSMILPVKKNLEIGLGLVNSVNISEFKAIMAHEFGHFSQRSMKLGSFTYNVNHVIYNVLYDNEGYTSFLNSWGRVSNTLGFFAGITVKIAQGIQWILQQMYKFINKNYMSLSREMEFHADAVAASVSGGNNLVSALIRLEVADGCYTSALDNANDQLKKNKIARNIFDNQLTIFRELAKEHKFPVKQGIPEVSYQFIQSYSKSRVNYKNQWASHPTLEERKQHLEELNIDIAADETSAWNLFEGVNQLQEKITGNLYSAVKLEETPEIYDATSFEEIHTREKEKFSLPAVYKGFYDKRFIDIKEWDIESVSNMPVTKAFDEIFDEKNIQLPASIRSNEKDLLIVKSIKGRELDVTSFDFDGVKYKVADCDSIIEMLEKEIAEQQQQLKDIDKAAMAFFCEKPGSGREAIKTAYSNFQNLSKRYDDYIEMANGLLQTVQPFYDDGLTLEQIRTTIAVLKDKHEPALKNYFKEMLQEGMIDDDTNAGIKEKAEKFIDRNYLYFISNEFQSDELNELRELTIKGASEFNDYRFGMYKKVLLQQVQLLQGKAG